MQWLRLFWDSVYRLTGMAAGALNASMVLAALRTAETSIAADDAELTLGLNYLTKFGYIQPKEASADFRQAKLP